jgi:protocatechuate 3,4-dioxygenase beta subunit
MKTRIIFALTIVIASNTIAQQVLYCSGTVRYPSGAPAPGVRVEYYPGHDDGAGHYTEVRTDINGRYELIGQKVSSGGFFWGFVNPTNSIMARDWEKNLAAIREFAGTQTNVDLILQPAISLAGSVKNTEGEPVNGAEVELRFLSGAALALLEPRPKVDARGDFSVQALPQGRSYVIWGIKAQGYGSAFGRVEAKNTQTNSYEFPALVLKHADRKLAGRVVDGDGTPLAGAQVIFNGEGQPQNSTTNTDSKGYFGFDAVCEGPIKIFANYHDSQDTSIFMSLKGGGGMDAQGGDTNLVIELRNPHAGAQGEAMLTTTGTVFDPAGKPVMGASLVLWRSANPFWYFSSDISGKYKVHWQPQRNPSKQTARNTDAVLMGRDLAHNLAGTHDLDETTTNLDLHFQPGCTLSGSVQDADGRPFTNAAVSLHMYLKNAGAELARIQPDAKGSFSFNALPPDGEYRVEVRAIGKSSPGWNDPGEAAKATGYGAATATTNFSKPSQSLHLPPFKLTLANLQLAGTVVDSDDKPVVGMRADAWGASQMLIANTVTDADGHFVFNHISQGSIRVMAYIPGINNNQSFVQAQGGDTNIVLRLQAP